MSWRIYKEGQGKWARNSVAIVIGLLAVFAAVSLYETLADPTSRFEMSNSVWESWFGVAGWPVDYRLVVAGPILIALAVFGVWQYNHPTWAEFLIDTENELKNRVHWPSRKEVATNSVVVVVTVVILGGFIFVVDALLQVCQDWIYAQFY